MNFGYVLDINNNFYINKLKLINLSNNNLS